MDKQYYILTRSSHFERVFNWAIDNNVPYELHANRLRFRPHTEYMLVEYVLRYSEYCASVELPYPSEF